MILTVLLLPVVDLKMAAASDHQHVPNCLDDPNFATICSFLENFGDTCHIGLFPFDRLQKMLEDTNEGNPE